MGHEKRRAGLWTRLGCTALVAHAPLQDSPASQQRDVEGEAHRRKHCKTGDSQEEERAQGHLYGRPHNPPGDSSDHRGLRYAMRRFGSRRCEPMLAIKSPASRAARAPPVFGGCLAYPKQVTRWREGGGLRGSRQRG